MPPYDRLLLRYLFGFGALLCVPAVVVFVLFAISYINAIALQSATPCGTATRAQSSTCLSDIAGQITARADHYRSPSTLTIAFETFTAKVGYDCSASPRGACDGIRLEPGTRLTTEWWKGSLVRLGALGARPEVMTDQNPSYQMRSRASNLTFALPGIMLVLFGFLRWQAPVALRTLLSDGPARRSQVWRVAFAYRTAPAIFVLPVLWSAGVIYLYLTSQLALAPLVLVASVIVSVGLVGVAASLYLERQIRAMAWPNLAERVQKRG